MPCRIPRPSPASVVFIDTSILINYLFGDMSLPGFSGLLDKTNRDFVNTLRANGIPLRITTTVKSQAKHWRDILRRKAEERGLPPYLFSKVEAIVMKRYDKLSPHLREENVSTGRYPDIQAFYSKHQSNARLLACRKSKNDVPFRPLPEESDMKILAEVSLFPNSYLIVADCDFHSLTEEIGVGFSVSILSQNNMLDALVAWGWQ